MTKTRILFICNANKHRSPTAEQIFKDKFETKSAGLDQLAETVLTKAALQWADLVIVMEEWMSKEIGERFPKEYLSKRIINLDIPDIYSYMQPELVKQLNEKMKTLK